VFIDRPDRAPFAGRRIAVIGSGIAGLSAAWLLGRRHRVTLYEADARPGGHSNTVLVPMAGVLAPVDTGFIVFNERNYPNLTALFDHLGIKTQVTDMSFSASLDGGRFEYGSTGIRAMLGQPGNVVNRRFLAMLRDIVRFYATAPRLLDDPRSCELTLGEYLDRGRYSAAFVEDHLLPMGAAIWSTTAAQIRDYPLAAFVRFFKSHELLDLTGRRSWRTVSGGSTRYVQDMLRAVPDLRLGAGVARIRRTADEVTVIDARGEQRCFDDVVVATHADQALALLEDADEAERALLGAFRYTPNTAILHTDRNLMPRHERVWSSWNYVGDRGDCRPLCVTYWMNLLQDLDRRYPVFLTLNPTRPIAADKILRTITYTHPLFDRRALDAQQELWRLQGGRRTWFAGSYFGSGFHEDALQAGLSAAEDIGGVRRPWRVAGESARIRLRPQLEAAE